MRHKILAVIVCLLVGLSLASEAWARAGRGGSLGSRGMRTYDRPMERTVTPPPAPMTQTPGAQQPMYNSGAVRQPGMATASPAMAAQGGFFQRNPMMGGLLGGLVGVGIGSMLFGHSPALAAASDAAPGASMLGTLLQIALIGGLVWLGFRMFRRRPQVAGGHAPMQQREVYGAAPGAAPQRVEKEFELTAADQQAFGDILLGVQQAWSDGNPVALRRFATPEVVGWMSEDLSRDQSNGVRNVIEDVVLVRGDITETWREEKLEYATAVMTFAAKDYMLSLDGERVVEGDPRTPVETTELWTFTRSSGGSWMLSAIEQA